AYLANDPISGPGHQPVLSSGALCDRSGAETHEILSDCPRGTEPGRHCIFPCYDFSQHHMRRRGIQSARLTDTNKLRRPQFAEDQHLCAIRRFPSWVLSQRCIRMGRELLPTNPKGLVSMNPSVRRRAVRRLAIYLAWMSAPFLFGQTIPGSNQSSSTT